MVAARFIDADDARQVTGFLRAHNMSWQAQCYPAHAPRASMPSALPSGGALLDENGAMIGITVSGVERASGLHFFIPIGDVMDFLSLEQP
jgi:hypothetical protein